MNPTILIPKKGWTVWDVLKGMQDSGWKHGRSAKAYVAGDLVGAEKKYHQIYLKYKEDFNVRDDTVVVVESENAEKNRQFVERLGVKLERETNLFSEVFYKGDLKMLGPKALLFLDEATLDSMHKQLKEYRPFIENFARATNKESVRA